MVLSFLYTDVDVGKFTNFSFPFNFCGIDDLTNSTISDDNIYIPDYITADNSYVWYWVWILPTILMIYVILRELDQRKKITFMSKIFGPPVKLVDFWKGPKLPGTETDEIYLQSYVLTDRI